MLVLFLVLHYFIGLRCFAHFREFRTSFVSTISRYGFYSLASVLIKMTKLLISRSLGATNIPILMLGRKKKKKNDNNNEKLIEQQLNGLFTNRTERTIATTKKSLLFISFGSAITFLFFFFFGPYQTIRYAFLSVFTCVSIYFCTLPSTELKQNSFILTYENEFCFFVILNNRNEFTAHVHAWKATP